MPVAFIKQCRPWCGTGPTLVTGLPELQRSALALFGVVDLDLLLADDATDAAASRNGPTGVPSTPDAPGSTTTPGTSPAGTTDS